jgi:hypothetical protein
MVQAAMDRLTRLQSEMEQRNDDAGGGGGITFDESGGLLAVAYYGDWEEEALLPVFEALRDTVVVEVLGALAFAGADEGANGTKFWDFGPLLERRVTFARLQTLSVELYEPQNHNRPIVCRSTSETGYEEDGELAEWLDLAPHLEHLTTPSAPDNRFFLRSTHPLRSLRVDAG